MSNSDDRQSGDSVSCIAERIEIKLDGLELDRVRISVYDDASEDAQFFIPLSAQAAYTAGVRLIEKALQARGRDWKLAGLVFDSGTGHPEMTPDGEDEGDDEDTQVGGSN